jgi:hypothetical protein
MVLGGPEVHEWLVPKLRLGTLLMCPGLAWAAKCVPKYNLGTSIIYITAGHWPCNGLAAGVGGPGLPPPG